MAISFWRGLLKYLRAGRPKRSSREQARCRAICERCTPYYIAESKLWPLLEYEYAPERNDWIRYNNDKLILI